MRRTRGGDSCSDHPSASRRDRARELVAPTDPRALLLALHLATPPPFSLARVSTFAVAAAAAAAALSLPRGAGAQPQPLLVRKHALQMDLPAPHRDVETSAALVSSSGEWLDAGSVVAGSSVSLVCGLGNKGDRRINVTRVTAMLSDRYNNDRLVRDLGRDYIEKGAVVDPAAPDGDVGPAEVSVAFSFKVPDEAWLRANKGASGFSGFPYKVRLSAAIYYDEHASAPFASAFFNETITVVAPRGLNVNATEFVPSLVSAVVALCVLFMFIDSVPGFAEGHNESLASMLLSLVQATWAFFSGAKAAAPAAAAEGGKKAAAAAADDKDESAASGVVRPSPRATSSPRRTASSS